MAKEQSSMRGEEISVAKIQISKADTQINNPYLQIHKILEPN